jgi:hypothetical protein
MKVIAVLVLTSLSLTAAFIKQPASSRATTDLSAMTKKKKEGHAFFNKRNLLESLPVIDAFAKHPVSSRVTKKMEEGQAFFDTVCILTTHELDIFLSAEYVVSPHVVLV